MPNYPLLFKPNKLPAVGALQKLLNRGGARLTVDGNFGDMTRQAVIDFQRARGLKPDGIVGVSTWSRISAGANLPIMDCVDIFDPLLVTDTSTPISAVGGNPLLIGGMCNGVEQAIHMILTESPGNVFMLRFHGHGGPGVAGVAFGRGDVRGAWDERAHIDDKTLKTTLPMLGRLRRIFGPFGCIQFMHCETGRGPHGHLLLNAVSLSVGVPATAAVSDQFGGSGNLPFGYNGLTVTTIPHGGNLAGWTHGLPDFPGMSVP